MDAGWTIGTPSCDERGDMRVAESIGAMYTGVEDAESLIEKQKSGGGGVLERGERTKDSSQLGLSKDGDKGCNR